jgi:cytochrome c oxidase assembly factor CtaG
MRRLIALAIGVTPGTALAHGTHDGLPRWSWEAWVTVPLLLIAALFLFGVCRLMQRSTLGPRAFGGRFVLFACGWLTLALSLTSPLHEAGERSFAAHMVEHELLMLMAAPLLVLSEPLVIMLWALPVRARQGIARITRSRLVALSWTRLTNPITATLIQAAALWGWHAPAPFDLALSNEAWHAAQHLSFLVSALLFWTAMFRPRSLARGVSALCLFATAMVSGALGALMALSQSPWYAAYARLGMAPFGLTPAEDQQIAGLIMWIPGGLVHTGAALVLIAAMLKPPHQAEVVADAA